VDPHTSNPKSTHRLPLAKNVHTRQRTRKRIPEHSRSETNTPRGHAACRQASSGELFGPGRSKGRTGGQYHATKPSLTVAVAPELAKCVCRPGDTNNERDPKPRLAVQIDLSTSSTARTSRPAIRAWAASSRRRCGRPAEQTWSTGDRRSP